MRQPVQPRLPQPTDQLVRPDGAATVLFYNFLRQQQLYIERLEARVRALEA